MSLSAADFPAFFEQIHGYAPFPWQRDLAKHVVQDGRWPDVLDLPTGSGKTSVIDIALFALAADPDRHPRRIGLVIDRRVVVDQAADHARDIRDALDAAEGGVVAEVRRRLAQCGREDDEPFTVAVLRGGMPRESGWARRPDQPVVVLSTVDQVGSRLLFRGYGVSQRMASIHAGLLGNDTLLFLDEVHLSVPFAETLLAVRERWRRPKNGVPDRWGVVRMSATPGLLRPEDRVFALGAEDREHVTLARRLRASKPARLVPAKQPADVVKKAVHAAREHLSQGARAVGVILNRVDAAREAYQALSKDAGEYDVKLLTGRMRPLDREEILGEDLLGRIRAGRRRDPAGRPVVVVATQCIEAGADFDFDALVTECASLDALRQRFGRLDRLGDLGTAPAVIVGGKEAQSGDDDPIYGTAMAATWAWLSSLDSVDIGIANLDLPEGGALHELLAPSPHAPILLPAHVDALVQTHPRPWPDPDIDLWLHGPDRAAADVQVVWRADMSEEGLTRARDEVIEAAAEAPTLQALIDRLAACPPGSPEALAVPIWAVRAWLADSAAQALGDAPQVAEEERSRERGRPVLVWRGDDTAVVAGDGLRPGDTIVVPADYGGIGQHGSWDPSAGVPVRDRGDEVQWVLRGRPVLRLDPRVLSQRDLPHEVPEPPTVPAGEEAERDPRIEVAAWLAVLGEASLKDETLSAIVSALQRGTPRRIAVESDWVLVGKRQKLGVRDEGDEASTEDEGSSFIAAAVTLEQHLADVRRLATQFADDLGVGPDLAHDVALAAWWHDLGKIDPRFQRMLVGGDEVRVAVQEEPLAKSAMDWRDRRARRLARVRARYPRRCRHELLSVALLEASPQVLSQARDPDLVLHLVASHHGYCRPFAPPWVDDEDLPVSWALGDDHFEGTTQHHLARVDSGIADRFFRLGERYGPWGVAWLEALVRLADHRASQAEQEGRDVR